MLEVVDIFKTFKSRGRDIYPLLGAALAVQDGEKVGILGKSGEGKSTLASIICGQVRPDHGNVYLDEHPLYDKAHAYDRRAGRKIQLIPQQPYLSFDPTERVGAAIEEALRVNVRDMDGKRAKVATNELLRRVALDPALADRLPHQLSGGQIQRAAIARAIAVSPDVIISDEATAMLDTASQAQIVGILSELAEREGIAVIFISHDEKLTRSFSDNVYRLSGGVLTVDNK